MEMVYCWWHKSQYICWKADNSNLPHETIKKGLVNGSILQLMYMKSRTPTAYYMQAIVYITQKFWFLILMTTEADDVEYQKIIAKVMHARPILKKGHLQNNLSLICEKTAAGVNPFILFTALVPINFKGSVCGLDLVRCRTRWLQCSKAFQHLVHFKTCE